MARPRLLVHGTVELRPTFVGGQHEILLGDLAGYLLGADVSDWKNTYTFVALDDLSLDERIRLAPHLAAEWAALAGPASPPRGYRDGGGGEGALRPHLVRLLGHARLLLVGATDGRELGPAGRLDRKGPHRVVEVGFARHADDYFYLHLARGGAAQASVSGALFHLRESLGMEEEDDTERGGRTLDRVMRAATAGLVDGAQISLAFWIADIPDLDGWEAHLATMAARAAPHQALAAEVASLLRAAPAGADTVTLPVYGEARRSWLPARTMRAEPRAGHTLEASVDIEARHDLALPAEPVWTVAEVDAEPLPMPAIFWPPRRPVPRGNTRGCLLVLLAVLVAGLIAAVRGCGRIGEPCRAPGDCRSGLCMRPAAPADPASPPDGYCSRSCAADADCASGLVCRPLPFDARRVCLRPVAGGRPPR